MKGINENHFLEILQGSLGLKISSQKIKKGDIFVGLKGNNQDGSKYAKDAREAGAKHIIISDEFKNQYSDLNYIYNHEDVRSLLIKTANLWRKNFKGKIIAIAGSNGKTTTKNLLSSVFKSKYKTNATDENENNVLGVVLTMLRTKLNSDFLIAEIGTNHPGELKDIIEILKPDYGMITNLGSEHLEFFKNLEGVAKEELVLAEFLKSKNKPIFAPSEDIFLNEKLRNLEVKINNYELTSKKSPFEYKSGKTIIKNYPKKRLSLIGRHNAINYLAAYTIAKYFKIEDDLIFNSLVRFKATENRSELVSDKILNSDFYFDAYNANPTSMEKSLDSFFELESDRPRVLILGAMKEMGKVSEKVHTNLIKYLSNFNFEKAYLIGNEFSHLRNKYQVKATYFDNYLEFKNSLQKEDLFNRFYFVKGSKSSLVSNFREDYKKLV